MKAVSCTNRHISALAHQGMLADLLDVVPAAAAVTEHLTNVNACFTLRCRPRAHLIRKSCRWPGASEASGVALLSYSVAVCLSVCSSAWRSRLSLVSSRRETESMLRL